MPTITSIKPQKTKKRVNIYLDGKFGFGIDLENYLKLGLKIEQELTEKEIDEIVKKAEFQKVYDKVLRFASIRPRSEKEFIVWLKKHKVYKSLHKKLFNRLKKLDFLNDEKFAVWWVEQRQQFRPRGKRALRLELRNKGINKEIINEVLEEARVDEYQIAKGLVEKKKRRWEKLESFEARKKMSAFLARKGFGWEVIRSVVKEISLKSE
jgi:regulatory protein